LPAGYYYLDYNAAFPGQKGAGGQYVTIYVTGGTVSNPGSPVATVTSGCTTCPAPSPTPTPTVTPSKTPSVTPSITPTPSQSTTGVASNAIRLATGTTGGSGTACTNAIGGTFTVTVYSQTQTALVNGQVYYSNSACTTPFTTGGTYSDSAVFGTFQTAPTPGKFTSGGNCA
jgi:hypothetical protein